MRILVLADNFAPAWAFGGPPKALFEVTRELAKRQHSVTVFTTNVLDAKSEIEKNHDIIEGVEVYYLKTVSRLLGWHAKIFVPIGLRTLLQENIKRFDVVLLASFRTIFNLWGCIYARKLDKPYVLLPYGSLPRGTGFKKLMKWTIDQLFGYRTLRYASLLFAQTEHEIREFKKYSGRDCAIRLIPLNIDLTEFEKLPPRGNLRRKLGIKNNEKIILFLGRLHRGKGLELLIKSFSHLNETVKSCRLVIVGRDDGYLAEMLRLIKSLRLEEKVVFAGPLYGRDRIDAYVDAEVFVMPSSNFEETSRAALEACASHTPVIVTKQASIPCLDKHKAGFTINYDEKELIDALFRILNNERLRAKMGENARKLVEETSNLDKVVDLFEKELRTVIT
jgi:glycosyltransferase involved in cell wall biosynthesis